MKFSTRTLYGLRAVLVLASRFGEGSLSVSQIARKEMLSTAYLEQILNALKKKNLVKSVRGPQGGYVLTKKPSEITLKTLFYALEEGPQAGANGKAHGTEGDEVAISNRIFWMKLQESIDSGLGSTTLKDLIDEARRLKKTRANGSLHFHI